MVIVVEYFWRWVPDGCRRRSSRSFLIVMIVFVQYICSYLPPPSNHHGLIMIHKNNSYPRPSHPFSTPASSLTINTIPSYQTPQPCQIPPCPLAPPHFPRRHRPCNPKGGMLIRHHIVLVLGIQREVMRRHKDIFGGDMVRGRCERVRGCQVCGRVGCGGWVCRG